MNKDSLLELRKQIVQSAQELALNGAGAPESRLQVLLELIRSRDASQEVYNQAFELAKRQDDDDAKLNGLLDLLFELDQVIAGDAEQTETHPATLTAAIESSERDNQHQDSMDSSQTNQDQ